MDKTMKELKMFFAGDVMLTRRLPNQYSVSLKDMSDFIKTHEFCFGNLETTVHDRAGYPEAFPGGGHAISTPSTLDDLKMFGFNVFSTANNHSMDYSHGGLLETIRNLNLRDIAYAGTGKNLADATVPAFVECKDCVVAMISLTASYHDSYMAGPQNSDLQGRPGVNPLRYITTYMVEKDDYVALQSIANKIGINSYHDQARKEGYMQYADNFKFGSYNFIVGDECRCITTPHDSDVERNLRAVRDAKLQADLVVVSIHGHQFSGGDKSISPEFMTNFAKRTIEAGADIVVCHGPHVMRGIEQYKNGLIFHGLGNFILQHESMKWLPEDQYNKLSLKREDVDGVADFFNRRSQDGKKGLKADPKAWYSFVPSITWNEYSLRVKLFPIEITKGKNYGLPYFSKDIRILKELRKMSLTYGLDIEIDEKNNIGILKEISLK